MIFKIWHLCSSLHFCLLRVTFYYNDAEKTEQSQGSVYVSQQFNRNQVFNSERIGKPKLTMFSDIGVSMFVVWILSICRRNLYGTSGPCFHVKRLVCFVQDFVISLMRNWSRFSWLIVMHIPAINNEANLRISNQQIILRR